MAALGVGFNLWLETEGEVALSRWRVALLEAGPDGVRNPD